jgi:hypothetical protein
MMALPIISPSCHLKTVVVVVARALITGVAAVAEGLVVVNNIIRPVVIDVVGCRRSRINARVSLDGKNQPDTQQEKR